MNILDFLVVLTIILSFFDGLRKGAARSLFPLLAMLVAIPLAGILYYILAALLSFLPGTNWQNFIGFFITMGITSAILQFMFTLPRMVFKEVWGKGGASSLVGGVLNILNSAIGWTVFALVVRAYPVFNWLETAVKDSSVLNWLIITFRFVETMLPNEFETGAQVLHGLMAMMGR